MNCPNCGTPANATDTYCSFCGAQINHQPVVTPTPQETNLNPIPNVKYNPTPRNRDNRTKNNIRALVLSILGIIIAIAIATGIFSYINHNNEMALWEECCAKKQIDDLRTYMEKYPDGKHYDEAKEMLDKLVRDKEAWDQARVSNDEEHLRDFIRNHPGSEHIDDARQILDDIVWNKALNINTKDAFNQYIKEFPDGTHIADAHNHFDEKLRAELTDSERDNVSGTIQNFLLGLENWNVDLLLSTCNSEMSNFMGKLHPTLNDVRDYYDAFRESDIDSIGFTAPSVIVNKVIRNDKTTEYKVTFTTTRRMRREGVDEELVAVMKGQALLDDFFRFKELTMDKDTQ